MAGEENVCRTLTVQPPPNRSYCNEIPLSAKYVFVCPIEILRLRRLATTILVCYRNVFTYLLTYMNGLWCLKKSVRYA